MGMVCVHVCVCVCACVGGSVMGCTQVRVFVYWHMKWHSSSMDFVESVSQLLNKLTMPGKGTLSVATGRWDAQRQLGCIFCV